VSEDGPLRERLYPHRSDPPRAADDLHRGLDLYDKIPVERRFMDQPEFRGTVLRLPAVYGPGDDQHRLFPYLKRMDDGRPAVLLAQSLARWRWTRGYVENVAEAIVRAVVDERAAGRIYNVGEPDALSEAGWVEAIGRAARWSRPSDRWRGGNPGRVLAVPEAQLPETMRPRVDYSQDCVADTGRLRRELSYTEPVPRDEALGRTVEWERANPPERIDPDRFDYAAEDAVLAQAEGGTQE
jgi:nucleoside-diphosphate-sugar epimerase